MSVIAPGIALRKGIVIADTPGCHFGYPLMSLTIERLNGLKPRAILETVLAPLSLETLAELRLCELVEKLFEILAAIPPNNHGMTLNELLDNYNQWLESLDWFDQRTRALLQLTAVSEPTSLRYDQGISCSQLNRADTNSSTSTAPLRLVKIPNRPTDGNYYKQTSFFVAFENIIQLAKIPQQNWLFSLVDTLRWYEAKNTAAALLQELEIKTEDKYTMPVFMHWSYNCMKIINYGLNSKSFGGQNVIRGVPLSIRVGPFQEVLELLTDETVEELVTNINKDRDNYLYKSIALIFLNRENKQGLPPHSDAYIKLEQWLFHEVQELFKVLKIRYEHGKHHVYKPFSPTPYIVTKDNEKLVLPDPGKAANYLRDFVLNNTIASYYFLYELTPIEESNYCVVEFRLNQCCNTGLVCPELPFNDPDRPFDPSCLTEIEQQMLALLFENRVVQTFDTFDNDFWLQCLWSLVKSLPLPDIGQTQLQSDP